MATALELLMSKELPKPCTAVFEVKRLTKEFGEPFNLKLQQLGYSTVASIRERNADDMSCHIILESVVEPDLKSAGLREKYGCATPVDLIKKIFIPGEIEDISRQAEVLAGYRTNTLKEVKKN